MAGQDQSANLGGMLSQIGETVGSMGGALDPLLSAATKPRGDMNDPAHLANLAQWASSNGDSAAASMYMSQAREAKADSRYQAAELKQKRAEAIDQARVGMVNKYAKAVESGQNPQKAYDELMEFSSNAGVDVQAQIGGIDQRKASQDEQQRVAQRQAEEDADKGFRDAFNAQLSGAKDPTSLLAKVPDAHRETAQVMIAREVQFQEQVRERDERETSVSAPVDSDLATSSIESIESEEVKAAFKARLEALKPEDHGWNGKQWNTPTQRRAYETKITAIEAEAFKTHTEELADKKKQEGYAERDKAEAIQSARKNKVTLGEQRAWALANGEPLAGSDDAKGMWNREDNDTSSREATAGVIADRIAAIELSYGNNTPTETGSFPEGWTAGQAAWDRLSPEEQEEYRNG